MTKSPILEPIEKKVRKYNYKCRRCGITFKREPFGYSNPSPVCDECFGDLVNIRDYSEYEKFISPFSPIVSDKLNVKRKI